MNKKQLQAKAKQLDNIIGKLYKIEEGVEGIVKETLEIARDQIIRAIVELKEK